MFYYGTILERLGEKFYSVNIVGEGLKDVVDIDPRTTQEYSEDTQIIVGKIKDESSGDFYFIQGIVPPASQVVETPEGRLPSRSGPRDRHKILRKLPVIPGDVITMVPEGKSFRATLKQGAMIDYASPYSYSVRNSAGDYMNTAVSLKEVTTGHIREDVWEAIPGGMAYYHETFEVHKGYKGALPTGVEDAVESSKGYIKEKPSMKNEIEKGEYGTWTRIGDLIIEVSADKNYYSINYAQGGVPVASTLKYGLDISPDGVNLFWGESTTKFVKIDKSEINLTSGPSKFVLNDSGITLSAPQISLQNPADSFISLTNSGIILGNSSGIKFGSSSGFEFSGTASKNDGVVPNLRSIETGLMFSTTLMANNQLLVDQRFLTQTWNEVLTQIQSHTHPAVSGTTGPATLTILKNLVPVPLTLDQVTSIQSIST